MYWLATSTDIPIWYNNKSFTLSVYSFILAIPWLLASLNIFTKCDNNSIFNVVADLGMMIICLLFVISIANIQHYFKLPNNNLNLISYGKIKVLFEKIFL